GGTYDIGIQALSGAAERNDDIFYICYDNEAYMNTGVQRSGSTPLKAWTTTTPVAHPKDRPKKDLISIMAAHRIPYIATASVAYPEDLTAKLEKAKNIKGTRFLLIFSPCPPGWKADPKNTIKLARLAVETKVFNLLEIENGLDWRITKKIRKPKPVIEYLKLQGRFRHLTEDDVSLIQENVEKEWNILLNKVGE
ncbi:pyruvate synthase subunit beta, partial [candidate division WOR-3 bacterium]|nr:pyruvate synthase subunit beta [candidate division WOR-3 bacterium]